MVFDETSPSHPARRRSAGRRPLMNRFVLAVLRSPLRGLLDPRTIGLRYPTITGGEITLPVGYVRNGDQLVVVVGHSAAKTWWRHFRDRRPVDVWWHGAWRPTTAAAFDIGTPEHTAAATVHRSRHPRLPALRDPVVVITIPPVGVAAAASPADR